MNENKPLALYTQEELIADLQRRCVWVYTMSKDDAEYYKGEDITSGDWETMTVLFDEALDESGFDQMVNDIIKTN